MARRKTSQITVEAPAFVKALSNVRHALARDRSRPVLHCVLLESNERGFRLVASDNYRMAIASVPGDSQPAFGQRLIDADDVTLLLRFLKGRSGLLLIEATEPTVTFTTGLYGLTLPLVLGTYPDTAIVEGAVNALTTMGVNVDFLRELPKGPGPLLRMTVGGPKDPILLRGDGWREYIMPALLAPEGAPA